MIKHDCHIADVGCRFAIILICPQQAGPGAFFSVDDQRKKLNGKCLRVAETFSPYITARQFDAFRFEIQDEFGDCGQVLHEHKT